MKPLAGRIWTLANAIMLVAFVAAVIVQYNDPDPLSWMAIWGAAAIVCGLELRRRTRAWLPALVALVAFGWAATLGPRVVGKVPFGAMFEEFEMRDLGVEESREFYGLLLIGGWMTAVAGAAARRPSQRVRTARAARRPGA